MNYYELRNRTDVVFLKMSDCRAKDLESDESEQWNRKNVP